MYSVLRTPLDNATLVISACAPHNSPPSDRVLSLAHPRLFTLSNETHMDVNAWARTWKAEVESRNDTLLGRSQLVSLGLVGK